MRFQLFRGYYLKYIFSQFILSQRLLDDEMLPETCYESAHMNCYRVKYDKNKKRAIEYKHNTKSKFEIDRALKN